MLATQALRVAAAKLLAADPATLAPVANNLFVALVMAPFSPSELTTFADITLASFTGSAPLAVGLGTQPDGLDPLTTDDEILLKPPAGGFAWFTTGTSNLPQTIYGYVLLDHAQTTVMASQLLDNPVTVNASGQLVADLTPSIRQLANSMK